MDVKNKNTIRNSEISFKLIEEELKTKQLDTKNQLLSTKNKKQQQFLFGMGILFVMLGVLLFFFFQKLRADKKVKQLELKEKETLQNHIKVREDELSAMILTQNQKFKELNEIKTSLSDGVNKECQIRVKEAEKSLSHFLNESEPFNLFKERLESQYPGLVFKLKSKHPELSKNDIKHALLIKLDFSIKESADLLYVTPGTVRNSRYRMAQKISLPEGKEIKDYLQEL